LELGILVVPLPLPPEKTLDQKRPDDVAFEKKKRVRRSLVVRDLVHAGTRESGRDRFQ